jgi:hypothetical protein
MHISTLSVPKSRISDASRLALDGSGASLVPRKASVEMETLRSTFALSASWMVAICRDISIPPDYTRSVESQTYQLMLTLANVECRKIYSTLSVQYFSLLHFVSKRSRRSIRTVVPSMLHKTRPAFAVSQLTRRVHRSVATACRARL